MSSSTQQKQAEAEALGLTPGHVIDGQFIIEHLLGAGGQGMVFKVRHLEWNQDFALKVPLPASVETKEARDRVVKEAETWIRMGVHPNIVRCWFVRPVQGLPGLFLDLIEGGSLEDKLESQVLRPGHWESIIFTLLQIAEGLTHSHSKGVVHRDLKPENLLMRESGQVCITDFGLVKTLSEAEMLDPTGEPLPENSSISDGPMGTPRYGAPEQWMDPDSISPATDIYSLGTLMFEMITGQRPFEPPGTQIGSMALINKHIAEHPPDPLSIRADIPDPLVKLCLQCMSKEPENRPPSAMVLLEELNYILQTTVHKSYGRPAPIPAGERPSLLNNAAVSLYSLGKPQKARELLLKGLMLEAGHPQCLYNLVQLDRREGKIGRQESFRRLRRARATFQLALLYLEEGLGKKAIENLNRVKDKERSGFFYRTEGDALMYARQYTEAHQAYEKAQALMPNDLPTKFRKKLAQKRIVGWNGHSYFPSLQSIFQSRASGPDSEILLSNDGQVIVGISPQEIVMLCLTNQTILKRHQRPPEATSVATSWIGEERLILQDRNGFEVWNLKAFSLEERGGGRVLAVAPNLGRFAVLTNEGVIFVDYTRAARGPLDFPPEIKPSRYVFASFTPSGLGVGLLCPDGRIASVQNRHVVPLNWPPPLQDLRAIRLFLLGQGFATIATTSGRLETMDLQDKKARYGVELGFCPETLVAEADGNALVAASHLAFTILGRQGELLLRGRGPCAVDSSRSYALLWLNGQLHLYQLSPFQLVRSWDEKIEQPVKISISHNGARAVTLGGDGVYKIWDVDETHRVYERHLLVTPGESYEQLMESFQSYLDDFNEALRCFEENRFAEACTALSRARAIPGFQQAEEALELQWALCGRLKREDLEAIWERLYISDAVACELSPDGNHLLIAQKTHVDLFHICGPQISTAVSLEEREEILGASYIVESKGPPAVAVISKSGRLEYSHGETGERLLEKDLGLGPLTHVSFSSSLAFLHTRKGVLATLDLHAGEILAHSQLEGRRFESAFHLAGEKVMVITDRELLLLELRKATYKPWLPVNLERLPGNITFVKDEPECQVRLTGFSDGTLIVSRLKDGHPLFGINHEIGPVTGAAINASAALGVSVSSKGGLTLFGLDTGRMLERFVAHSASVEELSITEDGRYFTTRSADVQFRLWELSWRLSDQLGHRKVDWLPQASSSRLGSFFRR